MVERGYWLVGDHLFPDPDQLVARHLLPDDPTDTFRE